MASSVVDRPEAAGAKSARVHRTAAQVCTLTRIRWLEQERGQRPRRNIANVLGSGPAGRIKPVLEITNVMSEGNSRRECFECGRLLGLAFDLGRICEPEPRL